MKVLVTGATGLTGANVCQQLVERGDDVRALVRSAAAAQALADLGVELVVGDITDADAVSRAAKGTEAAIHTAALLGGSSQDPAEFQAVNVDGTRHVLDAAATHGLRRVVAFSTGTFFDLNATEQLEDAPLLDDPPSDPYTVTKLAAFRLAHERAEAGQDVLTCHPGAIYGPGAVVERALGRTSYNRVLLAAIRGRFTRQLRYPVSWVSGQDVARGALAALDRGVAGSRYWLVGRPEDRVTTAEACNRAIRIAGFDHRIDDVDHRDDPEGLAAEFGPTLMAVAAALDGAEAKRRSAVSKTGLAIGYAPASLDEGLTRYVDWLRELRRIGPR